PPHRTRRPGRPDRRPPPGPGRLRGRPMKRPLLLLAAALLAAPGAAQAQSYVRAGLGYDVSNETGFRDQDCQSTAPPALFGCGAAARGGPLTAGGDFGRSVMVQLGLGRRFAPYLRGEVEAAWRPDLAFDGQANFVRTPGEQPVSAKLDSRSLLAAAYAD